MKVKLEVGRAGGKERWLYRARSRNHFDGEPLGQRLRDDPVAGIADARITGVGADADRKTSLEEAQDSRTRLGFVLLAVGKDGLGTGYAVLFEEDSRMTRVLAGKGMHFPEHTDRPQGDVLQISDRGGYDVQLAHFGSWSGPWL